MKGTREEAVKLPLLLWELHAGLCCKRMEGTRIRVMGRASNETAKHKRKSERNSDVFRQKNLVD